jgi:hypothetical protein
MTEVQEIGPKMSKREIANFLGVDNAPSNLELGGEKYSAGMVPWWKDAVPNMIFDKYREEYRGEVKGEINPIDVLRSKSKMSSDEEVEVKLLYHRKTIVAHQMIKDKEGGLVISPGPTREMINEVAGYLYDIGFQPRMRRGQGFIMPGYDNGEGYYSTIYEGIRIKVDSGRMVSLVMSGNK